jgi:hypothetical protein
MTQCHACFGKGSASVYAMQEVAGDFEGDRIRSHKKHIANRPCKHCKGKGTCDCAKCSTYPKE